ncbi:MAG: hypothetical protein ABI840_03225 [bacterium]
MFEDFSLPLASRQKLMQRLFQSGLMAILIIVSSLSIGMLGFHFTVGTNFVDSFFNASMILGGMGLVSVINNDSGKIFAGCYAIFSGAAFLSCIAIFISPIIHRLFHRYHVDNGD